MEKRKLKPTKIKVKKTKLEKKSSETKLNTLIKTSEEKRGLARNENKLKFKKTDDIRKRINEKNEKRESKNKENKIGVNLKRKNKDEKSS